MEHGRATVEMALALEGEDELGARETRAYILLKADRIEEAGEDYKLIAPFFWSSPYYLLGAGLVEAEIGNRTEARELLVRGLAAAEPFECKGAQVADLVAMAEASLVELMA